MFTTVTLAGTKLSIKKNTHAVFICDGNERSARLRAWSHVTGSVEKVFAAFDDHGRDCYVILRRDEYDASAPPQYALTENDEKLIQDAKDLKAKREKEQRDRAAKSKKEDELYKFVPVVAGGVNFSKRQRILAFNEKVMICHRQGHTYSAGRFDGNAYSPARICVMSCKIVNGSPVYAGTDSEHHLGKELELANFRFGRRGIDLIKPMLLKYISVPIKHRDAWKNWHGECTLDLRETK